MMYIMYFLEREAMCVKQRLETSFQTTRVGVGVGIVVPTICVHLCTFARLRKLP
jgi:hypothetical protein